MTQTIKSFPLDLRLIDIKGEPKKQKNRGPLPYGKTRSNVRRLLTEDQVKELRRLWKKAPYGSHLAVAKKFGLKMSSAEHIAYGNNYAWVKDDDADR